MPRITLISSLSECKIRNLAKALRDKPILLKCPVNATAALKRSTHITWKKLIAGSPQDIQPKSEEVKINGTSLTIQFVNETTVGWYRCAYNLQDIQHCFDFNLQLQGKVLAPSQLSCSPCQVKKGSCTHNRLRNIFLIVNIFGESQCESAQHFAVNAWFCLLSPSEPSKPATEHREQGSTGAHIAIVVSVIFVTASLSARAGQLIYRRYKERLAEEANRHEEGLIRLEAIFSNVLLGAVTSINSLVILSFVRFFYRI